MAVHVSENEGRRILINRVGRGKRDWMRNGRNLGGGDTISILCMKIFRVTKETLKLNSRKQI